MKTLNVDALAALEARDVVIAAGVKFAFGSGTYRLWSGIGTLAVSGEGDFTGVGARGLIAPIRSDLGGGVDGVRLTLSPLETAIALTVEDEDYHQKPCVLWRFYFDASGATLLDRAVFFRGRVDTITHREVKRGESVLQVSIEGSGRDMSRRNARMRSDADQRLLGGADDGGMKHIRIAGEKTLYWGQRPARAAAVLNGGATSAPVMGDTYTYNGLLA